jgi:hypothetical protein
VIYVEVRARDYYGKPDKKTETLPEDYYAKYKDGLFINRKSDNDKKRHYVEEKDSKWFDVLATICEFLSKYLRLIFTISLITFCVILMILYGK